MLLHTPTATGVRSAIRPLFTLDWMEPSFLANGRLRIRRRTHSGELAFTRPGVIYRARLDAGYSATDTYGKAYILFRSRILCNICYMHTGAYSLWMLTTLMCHWHICLRVIYH